jgi:hypothetical protein
VGGEVSGTGGGLSITAQLWSLPPRQGGSRLRLRVRMAAIRYGVGTRDKVDHAPESQNIGSRHKCGVWFFWIFAGRQLLFLGKRMSSQWCEEFVRWVLCPMSGEKMFFARDFIQELGGKLGNFWIDRARSFFDTHSLPSFGIGGLWMLYSFSLRERHFFVKS